jgi:hypothetical protein
MEQKELTHEESLRIIQEMINMAKNKINQSGFHFLLWGILVIIASLAQYFMIGQKLYAESNWVWIALPVVGVPFVLVHERRKRKQEKVSSKFDSIYGRLWLGFGITMFFVIFIGAAYHINPTGFILALVGLATFVSGAIYRFAPLVLGAIVFWIAAAFCLLLLFVLSHRI